MRILQALHHFLPNHIAGVEVYTDRLVTRLAEEHEVGLLYTEMRLAEPNYVLRRLRHGRVPAYEISDNQWFRRFEDSYRNPRILPAIREALDDFAPDVVHVQHLMGLSLTLLEELRRRSIPAVMTVHDHWLECAAGGQRFHRDLGRCENLDAERCGACTAHMSSPALRVRAFVEARSARLAAVKPAVGHRSVVDAQRRFESKGWLANALHIGARVARVPTTRQSGRIEDRWKALLEGMNYFSHFLVPSRYLVRELVRFGLPADRIIQMDYGFPAGRSNRRREIPVRARRFGFLGSLVPHKGVHVLLEAFASLPPDVCLDLCGSLEDAPVYVSDLQQRWRHPGISFLGRLENEEVPKFLERIDCLVVPSIWCENAPLVIREAHLARVPVVASRLGGNIELLELGGGLLYEANSSQELAACLRRMIEEPGLLRQLAATSRPVKTLEANVAELVEIYEELLIDHEGATAASGNCDASSELDAARK